MKNNTNLYPSQKLVNGIYGIWFSDKRTESCIQLKTWRYLPEKHDKKNHETGDWISRNHLKESYE